VKNVAASVDLQDVLLCLVIIEADAAGALPVLCEIALECALHAVLNE